MKPILLLLASATAVVARFGPNVRVDRNYQSEYACGYCAIALGPGAPSSPPIYVAFHGEGWLDSRTAVWFQKSLDGGRTWLPDDLLIQRGEPWAFEPDITTDSEGNVYVEYLDEYIDTLGGRHYLITCVRASDGGATWTTPARIDSSSVGIGSVRIAADSAGNLLCAWNGYGSGSGLHIWSSVSTDRGATWSKKVRVDDDTTGYDCGNADVFVQPGTNHYLVVAEVPRWFEVTPHFRYCAYFYRSTDRGLTFQPGVQLDTFDWTAFSPHVIADKDHIICDYTGTGESLSGYQNFTESRTYYSGPDTWGGPVAIHSSYYDARLALSGDGRVHTALQMYTMGRCNAYYTSSSDHGASWSDPELVNEDTVSTGFADIGADSDGHAYVVWAQGPSGCFRIWFATNNPAGIAEGTSNAELRAPNSGPTVVRGVLVLGGNGDSPSEREDARYSPHFPVMSRASLLDISGRRVMELRPGANDVRALAPGVYFIRRPETEDGRPAAAIRKIVVAR